MAAGEHQHMRISFAAGLQPLLVTESEPISSGLFRTCALIAATPHTPVNRKFVTDRCNSHTIPRPKTCSATTHQKAKTFSCEAASRCSSARCTTALMRATSPLFGREYVAAAARVRAASAPPGAEVQHAGSTALQAAATHPAKLLAVPAVLQFEGWWQRIGPGGARQKCSVHINYHTDTEPAAFFVSLSDKLGNGVAMVVTCITGSSGQHQDSMHDSRSGRSRSAGPSSSSRCGSSSGSKGAELPSQGAWLCITGASGQPLDQWDLHVGAELSLVGRKVVLKKASCMTMAWLDAWAKLLLQHKSRLEHQLSKFAPVIPCEGLVPHNPCRTDWSSPGLPWAPTGGKVNLRHLRESVALLAARLRQHKAAVHLPRELQDLTPEGPYNWSIDELPQVMCVEPFTPSAKHSSSAQLLGRAFSRHSTLKQLPSLGHTPGGERPAPCNLNNLMSWLQSIPLAASAAQDPYRPAGSLLRVPGKMEVL